MRHSSQVLSLPIFPPLFHSFCSSISLLLECLRSTHHSWIHKRDEHSQSSYSIWTWMSVEWVSVPVRQTERKRMTRKGERGTDTTTCTVYTHFAVCLSWRRWLTRLPVSLWEREEIHVVVTSSGFLTRRKQLTKLFLFLHDTGENEWKHASSSLSFPWWLFPAFTKETFVVEISLFLLWISLWICFLV